MKTQSPIQLVNFVFLVSVLMLLIAIYVLATWIPWTGVRLSVVNSDLGKQVQVVDVAGSYSEDLVGKRVLALRGSDLRMETTVKNMLEIPDQLPSYQQYNQFFVDHTMFYRILMNSPELVLIDGNTVSLKKWNSGSILMKIPFRFWLTQLIAICALIISVMVWSFRRKEYFARYFLFLGVGTYIIVYSTSIYISREITLDPTLFYLLSVLGTFGSLLFVYSLLVIFSCYPTKLFGRRYVITVYLIMMGLWVNQTGQIYEWPLHAYHIHSNVLMLVMMTVLMIVQWVMAKNNPLSRTAIRWTLLFAFFTTGVATSIYFVPVMLGNVPKVDASVVFSLMFLFYVGVAIGVSRYRLMEIDRYWQPVIAWIGLGFLFLLIDLFMLYVLDVSRNLAFFSSIILVAWVYLPLRQFVLSRTRNSVGILHAVPVILNSIVMNRNRDEVENNWRSLLSALFRPVSIDRANSDGGHLLLDEGLALSTKVPGIDTRLIMNLKNGGRNLFNADDLGLLQQIYDIGKELLSLQWHHERVREEERKRIMRDLHDELGGKLLAIAQLSDGTDIGERVRDCLKTLRAIIYTIDDNGKKSIKVWMLEWQDEFEKRAEIGRLSVIWKLVDESAISLTPRQQFNIYYILSELLTNAIRHAQANEVVIEMVSTENRFQINFSDNGKSGSPQQWIKGKGLNNIRTRIDELGGEVLWERVAEKTCVRMQICEE
ncbi:MAG: hypothetical protein OEZ43_05780 [Gammaproteobacteria bacterium]|nr:hypothetical protein [Gammaproteobacteria bacterium]